MNRSIPWFIWLAVVGVTSAMIGVHWDISWHRSIGRDTFWTPAHLAIQLCGVIAGITCGYLILATTFRKQSALRDVSVNVFGFRAPLGAFIMAWGGFTMITSAPFDDWWHSAYGLDVKILSPPHVVLALGMFGVEIGALVLIAAEMNRASGELRKRLSYLFLYIAAMIVVAGLALSLEYTSRYALHSSLCYRAICLSVPVAITMSSRATGFRWAGSTVAGIYTVFLLGMLWILPRFPAQAKLGPVMHEVTQFVPNGFPLLIVVPALVVDLIAPRVKHWKRAMQAALLGPLFLISLLVVEWPFGSFLQTPAARNWVFGSGYLDYFAGPQTYMARYVFAPWDRSQAEFAIGLGIAGACAIFTTWLGMIRGDWLARVRR